MEVACVKGTPEMNQRQAGNEPEADLKTDESGRICYPTSPRCLRLLQVQQHASRHTCWNSSENHSRQAVSGWHFDRIGRRHRNRRQRLNGSPSSRFSLVPIKAGCRYHVAMKFTKMHGAGNDYVYVDCFAEKPPANLPEIARHISHRHFGVGADGLILIHPSEIADAKMQMFNADGSESEMCGNGIRCVAKYVHDHGIASKPSLKIETGAGVLGIDLLLADNGKVDQVTVDMGPPELEAPQIPTTLRESGQVIDVDVRFGTHEFQATCVSMGNPHCIVFVDQATDELVLQAGPVIERDPRFPNRINVEFVEIISPTEVRQRTWERGSGETWACGTGASAVCVAGVLTGRTERRITNHLLGGDLILEWNDESNHVMMTGPAVEVFTGTWTP